MDAGDGTLGQVLHQEVLETFYFDYGHPIDRFNPLRPFSPFSMHPSALDC